jgi:hypothetical protein
MTRKTIKFDDEFDDLIGKTFEEAKALYPERTFRVVAKDGIHYAVTMDFRFDRTNLTIVNDKITKADIG